MNTVIIAVTLGMLLIPSLKQVFGLITKWSDERQKEKLLSIWQKSLMLNYLDSILRLKENRNESVCEYCLRRFLDPYLSNKQIKDHQKNCEAWRISFWDSDTNRTTVLREWRNE